MNDKASLVKALEGSHTVFAVTDYWATLDADTETKQGVNMADAAKEVGVQHFIWSTLPEIKNGELLIKLHLLNMASNFLSHSDQRSSLQCLPFRQQGQGR